MLLNWYFNPVLVSFGYFSIQWYGLLFVGSFWCGQAIMMYFFNADNLDTKRIDSLLLFALFGTIVGARLLHCFIYEPHIYLNHPLEIFKVWKGGLASHGGAIGLIIGLWLGYKLDNKKAQLDKPMSFIWLIDRVTIPAALGSMLIRIANFLNSEIVGIPTEKANYGVIFNAVDNVPRHPVQLYEAFAYACILAILVRIYFKAYHRKNYSAQKHGLLFGTFMFSVFLARIVLDFFKTRQADYEQVSYFFNVLSVGQYLSIPCVIFGMYIMYKSLYRSNNY